MSLDTALHALSCGIAPIPCRGKVPLVRWKVWQTQLPTRAQVMEMFARPGLNVAIVTTGMALFDCDDPAKAGLVLAECGDTPHRVKTPRGGIHLGYRKRKNALLTNRVRIKGEPIDMRTDGGIEVIEGRTRDGVYEMLGPLRPVSELPVANIGWTRERVRRAAARTVLAPDPATCAALKYVEAIDRSEQGKSGSTKCFVAMLKCLTLARGDAERAWPLALHYNRTRCDPPWDEEAEEGPDSLRKKLRDARKVWNG